MFVRGKHDKIISLEKSDHNRYLYSSTLDGLASDIRYEVCSTLSEMNCTRRCACDANAWIARRPWVSSSFHLLLVEHSGTDNDLSHGVRIRVRRGSSVFQVAAVVLAALAWNADTCATVSHPGGEVVNAAGLVLAGKTTFIVLASTRVVLDNVLGVVLT